MEGRKGVKKEIVVKCSNAVETKNGRVTKCDSFIIRYNPNTNELMVLCRSCKTKYFIPLVTVLDVGAIRGIRKEDADPQKMEKE